MNCKGHNAMVGVMIAFMVIITAIVFIDPMKEMLTIGKVDLNCSDTGIATGERMTCIVLDAQLPIFILAVLGVGLGYVGAKRIGLIPEG